MNNDAPSWDALRRRLARAQFSPRAVSALSQEIDQAERLLGRSWPHRQFERKRWWPAEFNLLAYHASALPLFLALTLRLDTAADEPTFDEVLHSLKRGVTKDGWRHALLQLEVGRAMRGPGTVITYEPEIEGSANRADLAVTRPDGTSFLVETTSLSRADADMAWEEYEHRLWQAVTVLEVQYDVRIAIQLVDHLDEAETAAWLNAIELAARSHSPAADARIIESKAGRAEIHGKGSVMPESTFVGAAEARDGWRRLGRAVQAKAHQSVGPRPVWLRIDALDGFFQFTDWAQLEWDDRVERVATAFQEDLGSAEHLAGVVLSSGPCVALGATDPAAENRTTRTANGHGLRRLLSPHTVRETIIIPLRNDAAGERDRWAFTYSTEPSWLQHDLASRKLPSLEEFLSG